MRISDWSSDVCSSDLCIGIIELGGGYSAEDLETYFSGLGLTPPSVTAVSVDGRDHEPTGDPDGPDGEVMLDIEIAGAIAPEADIAVYFSDKDRKSTRLNSSH